MQNSLLRELIAAFAAMVGLLVFVGALTWWLLPMAFWGVVLGWFIGLPLGLLLLVFLGPRRRPP